MENEELLWDDSMLEAILKLKFKINDEASYVKLANTFLIKLESPDAMTVPLICGCIANLPDIFRHSDQDAFVLPEDESKIQDLNDLIDINQGQDYKGIDEDGTFFYEDRKNSPPTIEYNTYKFHQWLVSEPAHGIRVALGILSLSLLRLSTKSHGNVSNHFNGRLYRNWYLLGDREPSYAFHLPLDRLRIIKNLFKNNVDLVRRAIAMAIYFFLNRQYRDLDSSSLIRNRNSYDYFMNYPIAFYGYELQRVVDNVKTKTGWNLSKIYKIIERRKEHSVVKEQLENYIRIICYVSKRFRNVEVGEDGTTTSTDFYMYARVFDDRYMVSISPDRNKEMLCFMIGLAGCKESDPQLNIWAIASWSKRMDFFYAGKEVYFSEKAMSEPEPEPELVLLTQEKADSDPESFREEFIRSIEQLKNHLMR